MHPCLAQDLIHDTLPRYQPNPHRSSNIKLKSEFFVGKDSDYSQDAFIQELTHKVARNP